MIHTLRLTSGLIIFSFVCCHLINHIFGLISIEAMETARGYLLGVWRTIPGMAVFGLAGVIHVGIAVRSIYIRRTLRLPPWEWAQIILGLAIPFFLLKHLLGTRLLELYYGVKISYPLVLSFHWVIDPVNALIQITALLLAWSHACIGLHFWLRTKSWYPHLQPYMALTAILIPTLAMTGYVSAGNKLLMDLKAGTRSIPEIFNQAGITPTITAEVQPILWASYVVVGILVATPFVLRKGRDAFKIISRAPTLKLLNGRKLPIESGASVLEVLRAHRIPHASVCGGRGRCTTCRVRVVEGLDQLPPAEGVEALALARIQATPSTRLACQIRPRHSLSVIPLLPPTIKSIEFLEQGGFQGHEAHVTCMFVDIRGWTTMSEQKMPYDTLFILNQFFSEMNEIITESNGHFSQFTGDGFMALYGLKDSQPQAGAREAVQGAWAMLERMQTLNDGIRSVLTHDLRIGIGIHTGEAIVGKMGPPDSRTITAVGDTVNTAARLEELCKEFGLPLVVSRETAEAAALDLSEVRKETVTLRGRGTTIDCYMMETVALLSRT